MNKVELDLLSCLGENPLASNILMGRRIGISRENVARHIESLRRHGDLLGVSAQVNYSRVGLEMVACLLRGQAEAWPLLEQLCLEHPYTRYKIRCVGPFNALFTIFAIPQGTIGHLMELFETLVGWGKLEGYDLHAPIASINFSETDFRRYTPGKGWFFDWQAWENSWERYPTPLSPPLPSILSRLDAGDMRILREISRDVLRTQTDIAQAANVTESKLSRRLSFYNAERVTTGYRVLAGPFLTGLATSVLFRCRSDFAVVKKVAAAVAKLPFQGTLIPETDGFLLYATLSSLDIPVVSAILKKHCSLVEMFWCDYLSSFRWAFYSDAFQNGQWRADHDYMVSNVVRQLTGQAAPLLAVRG